MPSTDRAVAAVLRSVPGRSWVPSLKCWGLPLTRTSTTFLEHRLPVLHIPQGVYDALDEKERRMARAQAAVVNMEMPVKGTPYAHQKAAFAKAMILMGVVQ